MSFFDLIKSIFCSSSKKIPCAVITNTSPFSDNMNYYHYSYTGIFSKTNRIFTIYLNVSEILLDINLEC